MRKNKHKGIFILVEGLDGAGKTTALKKFLKDGNGNSVTFTYLKGAATKTFLNGLARRHPHTALFLVELLWTTFGPLRQKLARGENVIMDKYFYFIASHVPDPSPLASIRESFGQAQKELIVLALRQTKRCLERHFNCFLQLLRFNFSVKLNERLARLKAGEPNPHHEALINSPALTVYRENVYRYLVLHSNAKVIELDTTGLSVDQVVQKLNKIIHGFLRQRAHA